MKSLFLPICLLVVGLFASATLAGQDVVEIKRANSITLDPEISAARRLLGDVHLRYRASNLFCDSAYLYPNEDFEAFGNIRILQGDSLTVRGGYLFAKRKEEEVFIRDEVTLADEELTLQTDALTYDLESGIGRYTAGGTIVSRENQNRLTSQQGYYDAATEFFHFRDDVRLKNPEYSIASDTLKYSGSGEVAYFFGPTKITGRNFEIDCVNGWYNTRTEKCQFKNGATIRNQSTTLKGDSIFYDAKRGFGEMFRSVEISDSISDYIVTGQYGWLEEETGRSLVTEQAMLTQVFDADSLYLSADTLYNDLDSSGQNLIQAYHNVRIFKSDLQGKCDSLTYSEARSNLWLYSNPVMWSDENQITGDTLMLQMEGGALDRMDVHGHAFIASRPDSVHFNQIKGRQMNGFFVGTQLSRIDVTGNGQVVYYPQGGSADAPPAGMNRSDCSNLSIYLEQNQIREIALRQQVSGAFHPLSQLPEGDTELEGLQWRGDERPTSKASLLLLTSGTDQSD